MPEQRHLHRRHRRLHLHLPARVHRRPVPHQHRRVPGPHRPFCMCWVGGGKGWREGGREARNLHLIWGLHFNRFRMKQESVVGLRSSWTGFYWIKTDWIGLRFSFSFSFDLIGLKWIGLGWIEIFIRFYWIKTGWIGSKFSFSFCFIGLKWIRLDRKCLFSFDFIGLRRAGLEWIELDSVSFNY